MAAGVLVTAADAFVLLLVEQWGVRQLEAVFGIFIAIMAGSFGVMYNNADIPQGQVLEGQPCVLQHLHNSAEHKRFGLSCFTTFEQSRPSMRQLAWWCFAVLGCVVLGYICHLSCSSLLRCHLSLCFAVVCFTVLRPVLLSALPHCALLLALPCPALLCSSLPCPALPCPALLLFGQEMRLPTMWVREHLKRPVKRLLCAALSGCLSAMMSCYNVLQCCVWRVQAWCCPGCLKQPCPWQ